MRGVSIIMAAASLLAWSGTGQGAAATWTMPADYAGAFSSYAVDIGTHPDGTAFLTLGYRHEYAPDPVYAAYWTNNPAAVTPLDHAVSDPLGFTAAVSAGNWIGTYILVHPKYPLLTWAVNSAIVQTP